MDRTRSDAPRRFWQMWLAGFSDWLCRWSGTLFGFAFVAAPNPGDGFSDFRMGLIGRVSRTISSNVGLVLLESISQKNHWRMVGQNHRKFSRTVSFCFMGATSGVDIYLRSRMGRLGNGSGANL